MWSLFWPLACCKWVSEFFFSWHTLLPSVCGYVSCRLLQPCLPALTQSGLCPNLNWAEPMVRFDSRFLHCRCIACPLQFSVCASFQPRVCFLFQALTPGCVCGGKSRSNFEPAICGLQCACSGISSSLHSCPPLPLPRSAIAQVCAISTAPRR